MCCGDAAFCQITLTTCFPALFVLKLRASMGETVMIQMDGRTNMQGAIVNGDSQKKEGPYNK